ncbi:MAG: hypothetical protein ABSB49_13405 [Polyangia bacterium]
MQLITHLLLDVIAFTEAPFPEATAGHGRGAWVASSPGDGAAAAETSAGRLRGVRMRHPDATRIRSAQ